MVPGQDGTAGRGVRACDTMPVLIMEATRVACGNAGRACDMATTTSHC